jgi:dienelactone hydrolase
MRGCLTPVAVLLLGATGAGARAQERPTDEWLTNPVDRGTFDVYLEFFAYDADLPFAADVEAATTDEGVRTEHLTFQSTPGMRVTALLFHPSGVDLEAAPAVVSLPGGTARGKDTARYVAFNRFLARAGITVLAIDMLHLGERADGFFTTFDEVEKHARLYNNDAEYLGWVQQTVKDVSRAFDFLVAERGVAASRVGVVGVSRGGVLATIAGGADDRFAAVAILHSGHFDYFEDGHRAAACPANYIGRISPRPVFFLSAENDGDFLPETSIRPMHRLAREPKIIRWTPGGHGATTDEDVGARAQWLQTNLP